MHPDNPNQVLLATEIGVWKSNDISAGEVGWSPAINGLANVRVDMLQMRESDYTVLAATHGRGFFTTTWEANEQTIHQLEPGYQFISTAIDPINADMMLILDPLLDGNLDFVRNSEGNMFRKIGDQWINNIGDWQTIEGYLFHMNESGNISISGNSIDAQTPIPLQEGYQFIGYLPESGMDAMLAFEDIIGDQLDFVRNSYGNTLQKIGPQWVNNIGDATPGEGYLIRMNQDDELVYPETGSPSNGNNRKDPKHFVFEGGDPSDFVFTIYLPPVDVEPGDEVAAFCDSIMVGSTVIETEDTLGNDLAAFRTLTSGPGYEAGKEIKLKIWDASEDKEYDADLIFTNPFGDAYTETTYPATDGEFSIVEAYKMYAGLDEGIQAKMQLYPNPAHDFVNLHIPDDIGTAELSISNQSGKPVLKRKFYSSGKHRIDVRGFKPGIYLLHLITKEQERSEKLVVTE